MLLSAKFLFDRQNVVIADPAVIGNVGNVISSPGSFNH